MSVTPVADTEVREWHTWQPSTVEKSTEAEGWSEFVEWCNKWAGYTERTVPVIAKEDVEHNENRPVPAWHLRVYGGKR